MKLTERIDNRLALIESKEWNRAAIKKVARKIRSGGSLLKKYIESGNISLADIVKAMRTNRCLRAPDRDFGATYLEQIVGTAIRDTIPVDNINRVRELFGLKKLPPSELNPKQDPGRNR